MKHFSYLIPLMVVLGMLIGLAVPAGAAAAGNEPQMTAQSVPNRYIIHFKDGTKPERIQQIYKSMSATSISEIPQINVQVVSVPAIGNLEAQAAGRFSEIASIEPDYIVSANETPNDKMYTQQWGLVKIQAPQAWELTHSSSNIKIAILDSGIDSAHSDLAAKITDKQNFSDSTTAEDKYGHGTHVAGIAAAITNNGSGVSGVSYNASLMNVKVLGDSGSGSYSAIIQGIIWAADHGANVINLSMSGNVDSPSLHDAVDYAWKKGVVLVVAAGNNGNATPTYPANYENCIAVAATTSTDTLYSFSNYGNWVDVAAPGDAISTLPNNSYGTMAGTSMASPFVSGLAGLAFAVAKDSNSDDVRNDEIRAAIQDNCDKLSTAGAGSGRINANKTIESLLPPSEPPGVYADNAANVASNSATLKGVLTNMGNNDSVQVSFEYGVSTAFGKATPAQILEDTGNFSASITGLQPNTTYYFRAKAAGSETVFSANRTFTTTAGTAPGGFFGLSSGNSTWNLAGNKIDAMRFLNTAGNGDLTALDLLVADATPTGKVRFGVYADNDGKPGNLLLSTGETRVINGWTKISGLHLKVSAGAYYWLAFEMQNDNTLRYQSGRASNSHYWVNRTYGALPAAFPTSGLSTNSSPYVMRAAVTNQTVTAKTFGLNSGDSVWKDTGNVLNLMRFQNTAGKGQLAKAEMLFNTTAPSGKVMMCVYADNNGKPGSLIRNLVETDVKNGWVAFQFQHPELNANAWYWFGFVLQNSNGVAFLSSGANTAKIPHYWMNCPYGSIENTFPTSFNLTGAGSNYSPFVVRITMEVPSN